MDCLPAGPHKRPCSFFYKECSCPWHMIVAVPQQFRSASTLESHARSLGAVARAFPLSLL